MTLAKQSDTLYNNKKVLGGNLFVNCNCKGKNGKINIADMIFSPMKRFAKRIGIIPDNTAGELCCRLGQTPVCVE